MKIRSCALTTITAAAMIAAGTSTAMAAPEPTAPEVTYRAELIDKTVTATLDGGTFEFGVDRLSVAVKDIAGQVLDTLPLTFELDGQKLPLLQEISADGHTLRLTPDAAGIDRDALKPVASPVENQLAMNDLINAVSIGTSIGSLVGTAIGAVAGIGVGVAIAGASCVVLSLGCVVAVLPIVTLVGAVGGLAGMVIGGGPTAAVAAYNYFTTLNAAPGTSRYAPHVPGANR